MPAYHFLDSDVVLKELQVTLDGLSEHEASRRLEQDGENRITTRKSKSWASHLVGQFKDPLILLLIAAGSISLIAEAEKPWESIAIFTIVMLNALLGFFQEYRAERALQALSKLSPKFAIVIREGRKKKIDSAHLVIGDILTLEAGDAIPADARLFLCESFTVNESSLTGESGALAKTTHKVAEQASIAERISMVYAGTQAMEGKAHAVVTAIGNSTEFGKIAGSLQSVEQQATPLQITFSKLAKQITLIAGVLILFVIAIGLLQRTHDFTELLLFGLVLAVGTVPSALPLIVTLSLSLGAKRLADVKLLLRSLSAAESMGAIDYICTDKTGTLTKNEMTVTSVCIGHTELPISGIGYDAQGIRIEFPADLAPDVKTLAEIAMTCNNASIYSAERTQIVGDPMEAALLVFGEKVKGERKTVHQEWPFDSVRKRMSVLSHDRILVKGAPERILEHCEQIQIHGEIRKLHPADRQMILNQQEAYASQALRVLAFAYKAGKAHSVEEAERGLIFSGLAALQDPPREGVRESIEECRNAGISVLMITGDHLLTARAIARQLGMDVRECIDGSSIDQFSESELRHHVRNYSVIARATPEHKLRLVIALQQIGHIVAMTGDGVNDAPALKRADVGLAMGITGTDVAKESSRGVLLDDNFSTIVNAIREGRTIFDKLIKSAKYLLSCNLGEIVTVLCVVAAFGVLPLQPLQILMINMLTDTSPAVGLGMERGEEGVMKRKPRNTRSAPLGKDKVITIFLYGAVMGLIASGIFYLSSGEGMVLAQTLTFTSLVFMQLFAVLSMRSFRPTINNLSLTSNVHLTGGILVSVLLQICVIYIPFFQPILGTTALNFMHWVYVFGAGVFAFLLFEFGKIFLRERAGQ